MNKIELDESMLEQDRINRFLNMIATEYGGNLATEYGTYYINKCKKISELEKKIERLNNIIDELEKWLNDNENLLIHYDYESKYEYIYVDELLKKLKELKGDKDE